jgi:hypothetical protein
MKLLKLLLTGVLLFSCSNLYARVVTYAGSSCTPGYGDTYTVDTLGSMISFSYNEGISIACNIPTVQGENTINSITIHYINNHPTSQLLCYLRGASSQQVFRSSGASQAQRTFTFNSTTINNGVPLMLNCTLPPNTSGAAPALVKFTVDTQ